MPKPPVFNPRKHKLLRQNIPATENWITLVLLATLIGIVLWVVAQKNNYNPEDRDVSIELLLQASKDTKLYNPPLKRWSETGTETSAQAPNLEPFPPTILDAEWQPAARLKQFGPDNLFEKINGEAPKFLKQGFQALYYLVLKSKQDNSEIAIELYDQGDMSGSMGIFSEHLSDNNSLEQLGPVVFFRTSIGAIGRKGQFFFRVAGDSDAEHISQKVERLVRAFVQLSERQGGSLEGQPAEFNILSEGMGIAAELITFQRQNVFQYDFVENVWFGRLNPKEPARLFLHQAASPPQASQLFEQILEEQRYEYEIVEQDDNRALLWHEFLKNYFAIGIHEQFVFGIENAPDQAKITPILQQLTEALSGG